MTLQILLDGKIVPLNRGSIPITEVYDFNYYCRHSHAIRLLRASDLDWIELEDLGSSKHLSRQKLLNLTQGVSSEIQLGGERLGVPFKSWLDYFVPPDYFEEWHFKEKSSCIHKHEYLISELLAYFLCKSKKLLSVRYKYMVWSGGSSPLEAPDILNQERVYTDFLPTEVEIDRVIPYFTGEKECTRKYSGKAICPKWVQVECKESRYCF